MADTAPVLFRIAKVLERRGIRGSTKLLSFLQRSGRLDHSVEYPLGKLTVTVPLGRNAYDRTDLDNYETEFMETLSAAIGEFPGRATLIDVGADIGLFSLKLLAMAPSISRIIAFEPNSDGFKWLKLNLDRLKIPAQAMNAAVADFEGRGKLAAPDARWSPGVKPNHTQFFLVPAGDGLIDVTTIDSVNIPEGWETLVIKVDVEGGEMAVLRGAAGAITRAANVIAAIEAHPSVAARTGVDPVECLRLLSSFRPFRFTVGELGQPVTADKPIFEQVPPDRVYNVVARSC